ncbi:MAG: DUF3662 domain-containing protein [Chloroflexi bacterium]|nr:DUF3662 domain-containing protein [Chloroflexota bacterium]
MSDHSFARLETQLERLIEGAFAYLFSKTVRAQDIALQLSRAMTTNSQPSPDGDPRPLAPNDYEIHLHPRIHAHLISRQPALARILSEHMVQLANHADYRLGELPTIRIVADEALTPTDLTINARYLQQNDSTAALDLQAAATQSEHEPSNPQLIINGQQIIALNQPIINIGRSHDNHITLNDAFVSRHHAQIRLRFGSFTLFDTNSSSGVRVNDVVIREHRLQSGDVIRMGRSQLVYIEDDHVANFPTDSHPAVDS